MDDLLSVSLERAWNLPQTLEQKNSSFCLRKRLEYKMQPWLESGEGRSVSAYLGSFGIKTGEFKSEEEVITAAGILFELSSTEISMSEVAIEIRSLQKKERSRRAHRNLVRLVSKLAKKQSSRRISKKKPTQEFSFTDRVLPLTAKDRDEIIRYLPRLRALQQSAIQKGWYWSDCYKQQIKNLEYALEVGRL